MVAVHGRRWRRCWSIPLFGWLVSRLPAAAVHLGDHAFFASQPGRHLLLVLTPRRVGVVSGQVFYVWFSVFNLFATMVFWALMADRFSLEQGKRFFGLIAVRRHAGAIAGPWLASRLAAPSVRRRCCWCRPPSGCGAGSGVGIARVRRRPPGRCPMTPGPATTRTRRSAAAPGQACARCSPRATCSAWPPVVILAVMATFLYFTRLQMVARLGDDLDHPHHDVLPHRPDHQIATLLLQARAGRLMQRIGVPADPGAAAADHALGASGLALVGSLAMAAFRECSAR